MSPRLRFFTLVLAGFAALVALLRLTARKPPAPGDAQPRLESAHSWHLTGWRMVAGQRLPWEIWGQAKPAFRYERLGNSLRIAQGSHEDFFLEAHGRERALTVRNADQSALSLLVLLQQWRTPEIDPQTQLSQRYVIRTTHHGPPQAELKAQYSVPRPNNLPHTLPDHGYSLDVAGRPSADKIPPRTAYIAGVTVRCTQLTTDSEGNLRLRLEAQPGLPDAPTRLPLHAGVLMTERQDQYRERLQKGMGSHDDLGGTYSLSGGRLPQMVPVQEVLLVRNEPLPPGARRPKTITLPVFTQLTWAERARSYFKLNEVKQSPLTLTLSLPLPSATLPLMPTVKPTMNMDGSLLRPIQLTIPAQVVLVRSLFYETKLRRLPLGDPTRTITYKKALENLERFLTLCPPEQRKSWQGNREAIEALYNPH